MTGAEGNAAAAEDLVTVGNFPVAHLALLQRVVSIVCRQRCLFGDDADDVRQEVVVRLLDGAALASFRGESSLETFVTAVTTRACIDLIRSRKGRWRPSTAARRLGYAAIAVEELVYRDGLTYDEAVAKLLSEGVVRSREELDEVWPRIPPHTPRIFVPEDGAPEPVAPDDPEQQAEAREREELEHRQQEALETTLAEFSAEDQFIVRRLFYDGRTVAQVARELGIDQRPLYRRRDKLLKRLRRELEKRGFDGPE